MGRLRRVEKDHLMPRLLFHPRAIKKLQQLHPNDRKRILSKIEALSQNPQNKTIDIRKLVNTKNSYRLRSGDVRAIFEVQETQRTKTIYIWDVDYRGSIY